MAGPSTHPPPAEGAPSTGAHRARMRNNPPGAAHHQYTASTQLYSYWQWQYYGSILDLA
eukprot:COSAG01_NODE_26637_length_707_cov_3.537829_2_plen_58_part_01